MSDKTWGYQVIVQDINSKIVVTIEDLRRRYQSMVDHFEKQVRVESDRKRRRMERDEGAEEEVRKVYDELVGRSSSFSFEYEPIATNSRLMDQDVRSTVNNSDNNSSRTESDETKTDADKLLNIDHGSALTTTENNIDIMEQMESLKPQKYSREK